MLSNEIKALISAAVELYSTAPLTQALIDEGTNKLIEAKTLLLNQEEKENDKLIASYIFGRNTINNINKTNSIGGTNPITISNLQYTSGNVIGYSGWTKRGLQLSNKNTISMEYIDSNSIEINVNTLSWSLRNKLFAIGLLGEDSSEYIMQGYNWGYLNSNIYSANDINTQIGGGALTSNNIFSNNDDNFHSITLVFKDKNIYAYVDGKFMRIVSQKSLPNIIGIKLYNDSNFYSDSPYESINFYKELTDDDILNNYNNFIKRINNVDNNEIINTNTEFNTIAELKNANLQVNSIVATKGYYSPNDNGGAKYKIVSYDTFYDELPKDCKFVTINGQVKTDVDNYGNHELKNGLVAKIISDDNTFTPEQWGAKGDGVTSDTEALICLFALTKTGIINFKNGSTYIVASRKAEECSQYVDNRYLASMIGSFVGGCHRPLIANCNNLVLNGNGATMKIPDNDFGFGMGMLNLGGSIEGLEIKNFIFDSNGLTMGEMSVVNGTYNKTSNHTIVYSPAVDTSKQILNNLNIHHNKFLSNGTIISINDAGGDHILIINPLESSHVYIEDNEFYNWGRWVYSVDLGGNGERFYDYKFNRNICIQQDDNKSYDGRYRGLGWIDFEARKCWTNLEVCDNHVEGLVGFAMNGNGKTLENFTFNNNNINYKEVNYLSAYPYFINFYSVRNVKNFIFENNNLNEPYSVVPSRYAVDGANIKNNNLGKALIFLHGIYGDIIVDNNNRNDGGEILMIDDHMYLPDYLEEKEKLSSNFIFTNNIGGIKSGDGGTALFCNINNYRKYNYINFTIKNNKMNSINISVFGHPEINFDPSQITSEMFSVKGAKYTSPTKYSRVNTVVMGGAIYKTGDLIVENAHYTRLDSVLVPKFYSDHITINKTYNIYCDKAGYFPQIYSDIALTFNQNIKQGTYYFTEYNLYVALNGFVKTPEEGTLPTHTSGFAMWGDVKLLWLAPIGRIRAEEII